MKKVYRPTWLIIFFIIFILITIMFFFVEPEGNSITLEIGFRVGRIAAGLISFYSFFLIFKWKIVFEKEGLIIGYPQDKIFYKSVKVNYSDIAMVEIKDKRNGNREFSIIYIMVSGYENKFKITTAFSVKKKQMREAFEWLFAKVEAQNQEKAGLTSSSV